MQIYQHAISIKPRTCETEVPARGPRYSCGNEREDAPLIDFSRSEQPQDEVDRRPEEPERGCRGDKDYV
jgi:hypothetical protein